MRHAPIHTGCQAGAVGESALLQGLVSESPEPAASGLSLPRPYKPMARLML